MVPAEQIGRVTSAEVERIFREHGSFVWRTLRRLGLNESDADDLCQEVFVIVHRKLGEFEQRSSMRTWLYGIAVRVAIAHKRRAHVRREKPTDELPEGASTMDPHDQLA
jgi:RNA polymerase sigma-70 factor (ECF subfamily)